MKALTSNQLLDRVCAAIEDSAWQYLIEGRNKPFLLHVYKDAQTHSLSVYIWNCTSGGNNRPTDEFRIQVTTHNLEVRQSTITLLLGWHEGYGVFVGYDLSKHLGAQAYSPSIQIKESALLAAHNHGFSTYQRGSGEIAVAFRPEFFVDYALSANQILGFAQASPSEQEILNILDTVSEEEVIDKVSEPRREVISKITRRYREHDFTTRVLRAYGQRCAMCGLQLQLIDAAHIIPVAIRGSTDQTSNGIALCSLHHRAYDRNLVSFDEEYKIQVSHIQMQSLMAKNLLGGLKAFEEGLRSAIYLPADRRDYPRPSYITQSRRLRGWVA
jgi:putative restriction endonuclease